MLFKKILTMCVLVFGLTGCSTFGFLFERLDWLSSWQLDRWFDLNDAQEEQVEQVANEMKTVFRNELFPALVDDLRQSERDWQEQASFSNLATLLSRLEYHTDLTLKELAPRLSPLMVQLNDENFEAFRSYLSERQEDWFEHLDSEEDKEDKRIDRLENWFGDLTDQQVMLVRDAVSLLENEKAIRFENTQVWSEQLISAARDQNQEAIARWLADPSVWWSDGYTRAREENRGQIMSSLEALVPTLSQRQIDRAVDEVNDWIENLEDVIENQ